MYPLVYHLGIDDYFPDEDLEPHLFQHVAAWRRANQRPSAVRRLASALMRIIRSTNDASRRMADGRRFARRHAATCWNRWGSRSSSGKYSSMPRW